MAEPAMMTPSIRNLESVIRAYMGRQLDAEITKMDVEVTAVFSVIKHAIKHTQHP